MPRPKFDPETYSEASSEASPKTPPTELPEIVAVVYENIETPDTKCHKENYADYDEKDIDIVSSQAGVSREIALKALHKSRGDLVNAILSLA